MFLHVTTLENHNSRYFSRVSPPLKSRFPLTITQISVCLLYYYYFLHMGQDVRRKTNLCRSFPSVLCSSGHFVTVCDVQEGLLLELHLQGPAAAHTMSPPSDNIDLLLGACTNSPSMRIETTQISPKAAPYKLYTGDTVQTPQTRNSATSVWPDHTKPRHATPHSRMDTLVSPTQKSEFGHAT